MQRLLVGLILLSTLASCSGSPEVTTEPASPVPYQTFARTASATLIPTSDEFILPTATIFVYTIRQDDTLTAIAERYGITLDLLLAANPGLRPEALTVGGSITIPPGNSLPAEPSPTPASLPIQQARCWGDVDGGLWCFALLQNQYVETLESISAQFTLLDAGGQELASQTAFAFLNTLPPGRSMPLAVHFAPPQLADPGVRVQVQVLSAIRLLPGDSRYLPVALENIQVSVQAPGQAAQVSGRVIITGAIPAATLWVLAAAFDAAGDLVGVRRWESPSPLNAEAPVTFDFFVYSLGPEITRVEFLAEARP
jgi:hypothetical protein